MGDTGLIVALSFMTLGFIVAILWAAIDWGALIRRKLANNRIKGRIYLESGEDLKTYDAKRIRVTQKAEFYEYRILKGKEVVIVPIDYPEKYVNGRRVIALKNGEVVASWLHGEETGKELTVGIIKALVFSGIVTDLVMALTASKKIPWWVWAILGIGVIVVIAFFLNHHAAAVIPPANSLPVDGGSLPPGGY